MNSNIKLEVKSGPGELIGITELTLEDDIITFDGLQFSEAGEYIIKAIPSNDNIKEKEIVINVKPQEEIIPQENVDEEEKELVGNRPIIEQIIQPTIKLDSMKYEKTDNDGDNADILNTIGFTPFFWYNGIQIATRDIKKLYLYHDGILPKCQVIFNDTLGLVTNAETSPLNYTNFEIFINSGSDILKSIHMKFNIDINQRNKNGSVTISGKPSLSNFYNKEYLSIKETSFDAIKIICKKNNIGLNSNIKNTNDEMTWKKSGVNYEKFIQYIVDKSYISDNSFMKGYIDFYWCFNYVDLEKEWNRDISKDLALTSHGATRNQEELVPLYLTNDQSLRSTPFYFKILKINNNSTLYNNEFGIFTKSKVYNRIDKSFQKFDIDSMSSKNDDVVILKGAPGDVEKMKNQFSNKYSGKIDTNNVHKNYLYANEQNKRNLINLTNVSLDISLPQPNFNLYMFQKIQVYFFNNNVSVSNEKLIDERLTGYWIIMDIYFSWTKGSLKQNLTICRKELGKVKSEKNTQRTSQNNNVNNSETNNNPF